MGGRCVINLANAAIVLVVYVYNVSAPTYPKSHILLNELKRFLFDSEKELVCVPNLFALWVLGLHLEQDGSFRDVLKHSHMQSVQAELWGLVHISDRYRQGGGGVTAVFQTFHQGLRVTGINLELM